MQESIQKVLINALLTLLPVIGITFLLAALSDPQKYQWIVFFFMAATPFMIITGIFWQNNFPFIKGLDTKAQPVKGLILTVSAALVGLIIGSATILFFSNGGWILSPQITHFLIISIIITIWLAVIVNFWPFVGTIKNVSVVGLATLVVAYTIAFLIWKFGFNYEVVADKVPWYRATMDPKGQFNFLLAIVYIITTCPIILYLALFDGWILDRWTAGRQPFKAIIQTLFVLILSYGLQTFFVHIVDVDLTVYMVLVPVSMVFGVFLVNNMTRFLLFENIPQPTKGLYKVLVATGSGLLMYTIYYHSASLVTGQKMLSGQEGNYQLDLWIADSMLGISFPIILIITGFFNFWPIVKQPKSTN